MRSVVVFQVASCPLDTAAQPLSRTAASAQLQRATSTTTSDEASQLEKDAWQEPVIMPRVRRRRGAASPCAASILSVMHIHVCIGAARAAGALVRHQPTTRARLERGGWKSGWRACLPFAWRRSRRLAAVALAAARLRSY